jgi:hypothetical protein
MKFAKSFLFLLFSLLALGTATAQREETLIGERGWGFSGIWGGYSHQLTNYDATEGWNRGGFFGFEFGKSLTIGWSNYRLRDDILLRNNETRRFDITRYNGAKISYAFIPYKAIHPVLNFEIGRGRTRLQNEGTDEMLFMHPSGGLEINVFRWFRLGLEGGYRFVNNSDYVSLSNEQLSGAYGQLSLKFGFSWGRYHKRYSDSGNRDKRIRTERD